MILTIEQFSRPESIVLSRGGQFCMEEGQRRIFRHGSVRGWPWWGCAGLPCAIPYLTTIIREGRCSPTDLALNNLKRQRS